MLSYFHNNFISITKALIFIIALHFFVVGNLNAQKSNSYDIFKNPPLKYRPIPFWHLNGKLTTEGIYKQVTDATKAGFGGVVVLPVTPGLQYPTGLPSPGMSPLYLSDDYFARYGDILKAAKSNGVKVILYDDVDFPSGTAGLKLKQKYPGSIRKELVKKDTLISGPGQLKIKLPQGDLMAVIGLNISNNERVDLSGYVKNNVLIYSIPKGNWKIMFFSCIMGEDGVVDYMNPEAVKIFVSLTYDQYAKRFDTYLGNVIQQTFFDDVGYVTKERGWTLKFNEKFKQRFNKDPAIYYPALWENIGPETEAARVALFDTRAELLAEGFPKVINDWDMSHGLKSSGHPPGNYEIQPVDMNFDIFKFNRHIQIPTMDAIFYQGHGREGFKLVSSAAIVYDRATVASEIYGAFQENNFSVKTLYGTAMEIFARGINFLIPHGMWYDPSPQSVRIPPLISPYSDKIGPVLKDYNIFAARVCMLLTGGRQVSEIGMIYPIASLEGFYHFQAKDNPGVGKFAPPDTDYLVLSDQLTNQVHRDFTFIHPGLFISEHYKITNKYVLLKNKVNKQRYKIIILPAGKVISYFTLKKIKNFYDQGGKIIATTLLPSKSAEFGLDSGVQKIVKEIFALDPEKSMPDTVTTARINHEGGMSLFIPKPDAYNLAEALNKMEPNPDILFESNIHPKGSNGAFSYIHKIKEGRNIYYFANSTDDPINTYVLLRGRMNPEFWDPNTGEKSIPKGKSFVNIKGIIYTKVKLDLPSIRSIFIISDKKGE